MIRPILLLLLLLQSCTSILTHFSYSPPKNPPPHPIPNPNLDRKPRHPHLLITLTTSTSLDPFQHPPTPTRTSIATFPGVLAPQDVFAITAGNISFSTGRFVLGMEVEADLRVL
jgi:hypothetical protein